MHELNRFLRLLKREYTKVEIRQLQAIQKYFKIHFEEESIPDELEAGEKFDKPKEQSRNTYYSSEWRNVIGDGPFSREAFDLITMASDYQLKRASAFSPTEDFGDDPVHLVLHQIKKWAVHVSIQQPREELLENITKMSNYISDLYLDEELFAEEKKYDGLTMRATLVEIHNYIKYKLLRKVNQEISNQSALEQITFLNTRLQGLFDSGVFFLFYIFNGTQQNENISIEKLKTMNEKDYLTELLKDLVKTEEISNLVEFKDEQHSALEMAMLNPSASAKTHQNIFLQNNGGARNIHKFLLIAEETEKGIYKEFRDKKIIEIYIQACGFLFEIGRFAIVLESAKKCLKQGGELLLYGFAKDILENHLKDLYDWLAILMRTMENLSEAADQQLKKMLISDKKSTWQKNYFVALKYFQVFCRKYQSCINSIEKMRAILSRADLKELFKQAKTALNNYLNIAYDHSNGIRRVLNKPLLPKDQLKRVGPGPLGFFKEYPSLTDNRSSPPLLNSSNMSQLSYQSTNINTINATTTTTTTITTIPESNNSSEFFEIGREFSNEKDESFICYKVAKDGECGYTAFGIDREKAYTLIKDKLNHVNTLLYQAVKAELLDQRFLKYLLEKLTDTALKKKLSLFLKAVQSDIVDDSEHTQFSQNNFIISLYIDYEVKEKKVESGWAHPCVLQALACIRGINLYIWEKGKNRKLIPHRSHPLYQCPKSNQDTHLLYVNNNHFDLLMPSEKKTENLTTISMQQTSNSSSKQPINSVNRENTIYKIAQLEILLYKGEYSECKSAISNIRIESIKDTEYELLYHKLCTQLFIELEDYISALNSARNWEAMLIEDVDTPEEIDLCQFKLCFIYWKMGDNKKVMEIVKNIKNPDYVEKDLSPAIIIEAIKEETLSNLEKNSDALRDIKNKEEKLKKHKDTLEKSKKSPLFFSPERKEASAVVEQQLAETGNKKNELLKEEKKEVATYNTIQIYKNERTIEDSDELTRLLPKRDYRRDNDCCRIL